MIAGGWADVLHLQPSCFESACGRWEHAHLVTWSVLTIDCIAIMLKILTSERYNTKTCTSSWTLLQTKHNGGIYTVLWESATRLTNNNSWHWPPNTSDSNPNNHHVPGQAWSTGTSLHIPDNGKDLMENLSEQVPGRTPELLASFTLQLVRAVTRSTQYLILVVLIADCCTDKSMRWRQQNICSTVRVNRHQH